jgi:PhnB protein
MAAKPIPDGYHSVTPYLILREAARAIEFYKRAFGAEEVGRLDGPGGKVMHAEITIGDSRVMMADEFPDMGFVGPQGLGGTSVSLHIYVEDVDRSFTRALAAGAKEVRPLKDEFYGDRSGTLIDPYGHVWTMASRKEDVSPEELQRRFQEMVKRGGKE